MKWYIHIEDEVFTEMGLNPTEAVLYSLVANYCKAGQKFERRWDDIAHQVNVPQSSLRLIIDNLIKRGFLEKIRKQYGVELKISDKWRLLNISNPDCQKSAVRLPKVSNPDCQKLANTPFIINNDIKGNKAPACVREEEEKKEVVDVEEIIKVGMQEFYEKTLHQVYAPDFTTITTAAHELAKKLTALAIAHNLAPTPDTLRQCWDDFLTQGYDTADQWLRRHWELKHINGQFQGILNTIQDNHGNTNKSKTTTQQQSSVGDDYIARQWQRLEEIRNGKA